MSPLLPLLLATAAATTPAPLRVRASEEAAPCVAAVARAVSARFQVSVDTGRLAAAPGLDVLVGSEVELTRALENGTAVDGSEKDVARIPWVLAVPAGNPLGLQGMADLGARRVEVWTLDFPAGYEARRALEAAAPGRVREAASEVSRRATVALLPLSLAGDREHIGTGLPAIVVRAAVATGAPHAEAARGFVLHLATAEGQRAFSVCR